MALFYGGIVIFVYALSGYAIGMECRDGWTAYQSSCYLFNRNHSFAFTEAQHYCRDLGGHLVQLETQEENNFVRDILMGHNDENHWIGMTDLKSEGVWEWFHSGTNVTFTDWAGGEPNNFKDGEDCAVYNNHKGYRWEDRSCEDKIKPICEIEGGGSVVVG